MALDFSRLPQGFNTVSKKREYEELAAALLERGESVCHYLLPGGRKENGEWRVGSLQGERGKSMGVNLKTGKWSDFAGEDGGKDLLYLWAEKKGIKPHEAYDEAAEWLGWERRDSGPKPSWAPKPIGGQAVSAAKAPTDGGGPVASGLPAIDKDEDSLWWRKVKATNRWDYFDENGELWVTVFRYERPGEKVIRPWDHKREGWKWPEGLRPLFNMDGIRKSQGPVILVEGEKCADRLTAMGHTATTMPGGASAARVVDWSPLRGRDVIRWADNDHPRADGKRVAGEKWLEMTRECLSAAGARSIRDVGLPGQAKPDGWDCADAEDSEIDEMLSRANHSPPIEPDHVRQRATRSGRTLTIFSTADADGHIERDYLVKGLIEPGALSVWYGPPGSGKTFLIKHIAYAIAQGRGILGRRVRQAPTLYIGLEGGGGIRNRVKALKERFGPANDFYFSVDRVALLDADRLNPADIDAVVEAVETCGARMVVVDTVNRAMGGGEENDSSTMGAFISACQSISQRTGAHVAVVHHSSKAGTENGPRGHSSLEGAVDLAIAVDGTGTNALRIARTRKIKDGADLSFNFTLDPVTLGVDQDGDDIVSMVVCEADAPVARRKKLSENQESLIKDIENVLAAPDLAFETIQPFGPEGSTVQAAKREIVVDRLVERGALPASERGSVTTAGRSQLHRALCSARDAGRLGSNKDWIWHV